MPRVDDIAVPLESTTYEIGAVKVCVPFITKRSGQRQGPRWNPNRDTPRLLAGDYEIFDAVVERFLKKEFQVLNISSALGTGKSSFLNDIISEQFQAVSVLIIGYRVALCHQLAADLKALGFVNYKDVEIVDRPNLDDRSAFPRVVCQLDSAWRLGTRSEVPKFDLVIGDEIEMLLNHISASTLASKSPARVFDSLMTTISEAPCGAITMDGLWGERTYDAIQQSGISQQLVINTYKPVEKEFVFVKNEEAWVDHIAQSLLDGKNVVVVTLSARQADNLRDQILDAGILEASDIGFHTSMEGDAERRLLENVQTLWILKRLVIYSPTIEAGTSFSLPHFHKMYIYLCGGSTTAQGLFQMTGRIRTLGSNIIECCAHRSVRLSGKKRSNRADETPARRTNCREQVQRIQWLQGRVEEVLPCVKIRLGGKTQLVPPSNALLTTVAHNAAQRHNSKYFFYDEFKAIAEKVRVTWNRFVLYH